MTRTGIVCVCVCVCVVYKRVKLILQAQQSKGQIGFRSSVGVDDAFAVFENVSSSAGGKVRAPVRTQ